MCTRLSAAAAAWLLAPSLALDTELSLSDLHALPLPYSLFLRQQTTAAFSSCHSPAFNPATILPKYSDPFLLVASS